MLKYIRNFLFYYITKLFCIVLGKIPYKINIFIGRLLGLIFYIFDFKYKYVAFKNIKYVFENYSYKDIIKIAKNCYKNLGQNFTEFFLLPRTKFFYKKIVEFTQQDKEILWSVYNQNKGVLIFSAHFGNWELLGSILSQEGFPLAVIAREFYIKKIDNIVEKIRTESGEIVVSRSRKEKNSVKNLLFAIKNKYIIGVLVDQNIKNVKNVQVEFLGKPSLTPISFVELMIKYQIPSVIGLIYKDNKKKKYVIKIIPVEKKYYENKILCVKFINDVISKYIFLYPEQWVWMHKRWNIF
jgi:KDO2-lipid IV(A) lauroyltransferase